MNQQLLIEKALRGSERLFRALFESCPVPMIIANPEGLLLEVNPPARQSLGYPPEELVLLRIWDLTPALDWHREEKDFAELVAGRRTSYRIEKSMAPKGREPIPVHATTFSVPGESGSVHLVVSMWEDVTAARRAAVQLAEQAALLDIVPAAVMVLSLDGTIQHWSRGAERLYGWTAVEATGRHADELLTREPADVLLERRKLFLEQGTWQGLVEHLDRGGTRKLVESRWRQMRDASGVVTACLVANIDVTEQKQVEQHVTSAQRMESIGFLAAGAAHDFNNVLAPILMSANLLAAETSEPRTRELAGNIQAAATRGAAVVRQMLFFARGEPGSRTLLALRHILEATVRLLRETIPRTIEVRCTVPDELAAVEGDASQISQVLMTLCVQARDAMPSGGALDLTADNVTLEELYCSMHAELRPGRFVALRVHHTGPTLPPDRISRIFEPYASPGGMGLSVAYGLVRSHGGQLSVSSEPGHGTTFTVLLPAFAEVSPDVAAPETVAAPPPGRGELVLVVDDEDLIRDLACQVLKRGGYQVVTAANGIECIAEYARRRREIAVVLMDLNMPQMDGRTAIKILRAMDPEVRLVLATGSLGMEKVAAQAELAAFPRLCKPFSQRDLLWLLHRLLSPPGSAS